MSDWVWGIGAYVGAYQFLVQDKDGGTIATILGGDSIGNRRVVQNGKNLALLAPTNPLLTLQNGLHGYWNLQHDDDLYRPEPTDDMGDMPPMAVLPVPYHDSALVKGRVLFDKTTGRWRWFTADGDRHLLDYRLDGDETINLRQLVKSGLAVRLSINPATGFMVEVVGLTAFSQVAYAGREGSPFKFFAPVDLLPSGYSTPEPYAVHVVVRHLSGYAVYGFEVARRPPKSAKRARQREGRTATDPLPLRRAVELTKSARRRYFVLPDGEVLCLVG
jgi:hypothetical protein